MVVGVIQTRLSVQGNVFSAFLGLHPCRPQRSDILTLAKLRKLLNLQALIYPLMRIMRIGFKALWAFLIFLVLSTFLDNPELDCWR